MIGYIGIGNGAWKAFGQDPRDTDGLQQHKLIHKNRKGKKSI